MPRVTRAAARADPVLADETQTIADAAVTEDLTSDSPASPSKTKDRSPLGETVANTSALSTKVEPATDPVTPDEATAEVTTYVVGEEENQTISEVTSKPSEVINVKAGKKSTRKAKGNTANDLRQQFGNQMDAWSQSMKEKPSAAAGEEAQVLHTKKKSQRKGKGGNTSPSKQTSQEGVIVLEDSQQTPDSPASKEAVEMLRLESSSQQGVLEDAVDATPSEASSFASQALTSDSAAEDTVSTAVKLAVVKEAPRPQSAAGSHSVATEGSSDKPEAVQRLESLFQNAESSKEESDSQSPLAVVLAQSTSADTLTPRKNPIEAIDALEENIAAVEACLEVVDESPSSPTKSKTAEKKQKLGVNFSHTGKPSPPKRARPTVRRSSVKASAQPPAKGVRESRARPSVSSRPVAGPIIVKQGSPTTSKSTELTKSEEGTATPTRPNAVDKVKQRSAISALHTPPAVAKSRKPVTKSNFQLPGEAAAAKLKAMKEEREKRREEAEEKARQEKDKPAPKPAAKALAGRPSIIGGTIQKRASVAPSRVSTVRAERPAASDKPLTIRPRVSMGPSKKPTAEKSKPVPVIPRVARVSTAASVAGTSGASSRSAMVATMARSPRPHASSSTSRPPLSSTTVNTARARATSDGSKSSSSSDNKTLAPRGKEIYNREKVAKVANEKLAKERLDAAKKARDEATIRGKVAARAWAEKNKLKATAAKPTNDSGKPKPSAVGETSTESAVLGVVEKAPMESITAQASGAEATA